MPDQPPKPTTPATPTPAPTPEPPAAPAAPLDRDAKVAAVLAKAEAGGFDKPAEGGSDATPDPTSGGTVPPAESPPGGSTTSGTSDPTKTTDASVADESTPPAEPSDPPPDDRFAKGFATLKKRERVLQERETVVKAGEANAKAFTDAKKMFALDPRAAIALLAGEEFDPAWEKLVGFVVNDNTPTASAASRAMQKQIDDMKTATADREKAELTAVQERSKNEAIQAHGEMVEEMLNATPELAPFLHATGSFGLVTQKALQYTEDTGENAPPIAQLVKEVEASLATEAIPLLEKLLQVESAREVARRILDAPPVETPAPGESTEPIVDTRPPETPRPSQPKTITQRQASEAPPRQDPTVPLTTEERTERALRLQEKLMS